MGASNRKRAFVSASRLASVLVYQQGMVEDLKSAWLSGRGGTLGARGEAFAWALRKAWYAQGNGDYGLLQFVRGHVQKLDGSPPLPPARFSTPSPPLPPPYPLLWGTNVFKQMVEERERQP